MTFGDRLKAARTEKGYTQEQLAEKIGVAKSTLTGYEKGNREPDFFKIKKIAEVLGISADYLLDTEKSSELEITNTEEVDKIYSLLRNGLIELGFVDANRDITDDQADILIAVTKILRITFDK